jgi:hypothetical protein
MKRHDRGAVGPKQGGGRGRSPAERDTSKGNTCGLGRTVVDLKTLDQFGVGCDEICDIRSIRKHHANQISCTCFFRYEA